LKLAKKGKAGKQTQLKMAIELEQKGYSKHGMTKDELLEEKRWINEQYSLDFMLEDRDIQEDKEVYEIIRSEVTKTKEQRIDDLSKLDGNLQLTCKTQNNFMSAVLQLLSYNEQFVEHFFKNSDTLKGKPFSAVLEYTFR
jgi:hypothetical protein